MKKIISILLLYTNAIYAAPTCQGDFIPNIFGKCVTSCEATTLTVERVNDYGSLKKESFNFPKLPADVNSSKVYFFFDNVNNTGSPCALELLCTENGWIEQLPQSPSPTTRYKTAISNTNRAYKYACVG